MRSFGDLDRVIGRVPARLVTSLSSVDVGRGSEALYRDQLPGLLTELANRARVASITASSAIEGIVVPDSARAGQIISRRARSLRTRSERELAGYRDALDYLFQQDWRPLNVGLLLHLHRLLFSHTAAGGGRLKTADNEFHLAELIDRYDKAVTAKRHHPVLLVGLFVLDLLVIHPFEDGNGRVARAVTNALLVEAGYTVCRYVSLEQAIEDSADAYYQALLDSTHGWHEEQADPWPWLEYFVDTLARTYQTFANRAASARSDGSKQERVRDYVLRHAPQVFRVADVRAALPGISDQTIRLVLDRLRSEGRLMPDGVGRGARWHRKP